MFNFKKRIRREKLNSSDVPDLYLNNMAKKIENADAIDENLYSKYSVKRGLRNSSGTGVVVGLTNIGEVIGYKTDETGKKVAIEGELYYRGYEIKSLVKNYIAENRFGFEEITYLLFCGHLPGENQLKEFNNLISQKRDLPEGFARDMILTAPSRSIMNKLARSVLALYCYDENPDDTSIQNVLRQSIDLVGYFPALVSYAYQAKASYFDKKTLHLRNPIPELSTAENILRMSRPRGEYSDLEAKVLDLCLILHAEHGGGNNSSFATHLVSSSGTDTYAAISSAISSLKGPKHGGANIAVINMIHDLRNNVKDISNRKEVDNYLIRVLKKQANDKSGLIYGMGHAIYTKSDPRAAVLKGMAKKLAEKLNLVDEFLLCNYIEKRTPELYAQVHKVEKDIAANVDLYSGFVYRALNIPLDIATPLFANARLAGWCAHRMEELVSGKRLMRPAYINVNHHKEYIPIKERKIIEKS